MAPPKTVAIHPAGRDRSTIPSCPSSFRQLPYRGSTSRLRTPGQSHRWTCTQIHGEQREHTASRQAHVCLEVGEHLPGCNTACTKAAQISTIVQFRAIDYGMETCELKLTMNPDTVTQMSSSPFELEVFRLNATIPLDRKTANYKTRPPRLAKVASIRVNPRLNTTWHRNFGCASDEVLTFEVACQPDIEGADCHLEWWQTNQHPTSGQ